MLGLGGEVGLLKASETSCVDEIGEASGEKERMGSRGLVLRHRGMSKPVGSVLLASLGSAAVFEIPWRLYPGAHQRPNDCRI